MDFDTIMPSDGLETAYQNGVHDQSSASFLNNMDENVEKATASVELNGNLANVLKLDDSVGSNGVTVPKEGEGKVEETDHSDKAKAKQGPAKSKTEKPSNPKNVSSQQVKKVKDEKDVGSNGSIALNSQSKEPLKSKSFSDRQVQLSKHGKSDAVSSQGIAEKTKLKPLKKASAANEAEGDEQSTLSPTANDSKPHRVGTLPNYGFSFKCDERAEKRKEFYSKLEEKIQAKEVEKHTLQAKSKENQEAEIKLLRKSLNFKATPMPSFYQEPPPPKVELKKIPTTRAKSPKLGRRKSASPADSEGNNGQSIQLGRLSLDEKVSQTDSTKGISPFHSKKPQRKSLPKLPSEKTTLSDVRKDENNKLTNAAKEDNTGSCNQTKESASPTQEQGTIPRAEPTEMDPQIDELVVEEQV